MSRSEVVKKTSEYVKAKMEGEGSGHDWWHVYRVWKAAVQIGKEEKADLFVVQLASLLHDIGDWKFHDGDNDAGPQIARKWLIGNNVKAEIVNDVCEIIRDLSFKGAQVATPMRTKEGMVVQDADRLDAIGAIGVARAFAYGGYKGREIYNPAIKPESHQTFEAYKNSKGPTINHFYEKLLLLKDMMNTKAAKRLAKRRHKFMEEYLNRFSLEWDGRA